MNRLPLAVLMAAFFILVALQVSIRQAVLFAVGIGMGAALAGAVRVAEKIALVELLWRIIYIDGRLDKHEEYLVRKLATLLHLSHKDMIDAKLKVLGSP